MEKSKRRVRRRPGPGSLRVQAWLHAAIWPLRQALGRELHLLEQGHLTWSHAGQRLKGFREARAQLGPEARTNLDDLIEVHTPELLPLLAEQEAAIAAAVAAAAAAQAQLGQAEVQLAIARSGVKKAVEPRHVPDLVEGVINRAIGHDTSLEWSSVDALRPHLEAIPRTGALAAVDAAQARLVIATQELCAALDEVRSELCDRYDLPPAPLTEAAHAHR